jgi:hypothetical protein
LHQPRGRRDCFGELVQIDGSHHWWFENRGPKVSAIFCAPFAFDCSDA